MQRFSLLLLIGLAFLPATLLALEAGSAKVQLESPAGVPLHGDLDRLGRGALGTHDPLWARALYLSDGTTQLFLVNVDLYLVNPELRARVLELAPAEVPRENIILTATHTPNGLGGMHRHLPMRLVAGRFMPEVLESTAKAIVQAMRTALDAKVRGAVGFTVEKQQALTRNRNQPEGRIDEQLGVIRVDDADGNPLALIANLAAHPATVPEEDFYSFSADFAGSYYTELERLSSPGCVAMFLNGAAGDQEIGNPERQTGWAHAESVGKALAARVKGIANDIACSDLPLRVASSEPKLPPTIAHHWQPERVQLQSLELGGLLLNFFPGEPVVEIGLELRRQALAQGYAAQMSVGLANDYVMYFVPRTQFGAPTREAALNFFGPGIAEWFYAEFGALMSRGDAATAPAPETAYVPANVEEASGARKVVLQGTAAAMGWQRGHAFAEEIRSLYLDRVEKGLAAPELFPEQSLWRAWPGFLDPAPLAVPLVAMSARTMTAGLSPELFDELEGMASATALPFDAIWMLQHAVAFADRKDTAPLFSTPFCTMFAALGEKAGADRLLIGRNLDWPAEESPVIVESRPDTGHRFAQVGFPWNTGVFTGMNDAGIAVMAEHVRALGEPTLTGPPVEFVLRQVLQDASSYLAALEFLRNQAHLRGYSVLLAGEEAGEFFCAVVEFGNRVTVRGPGEDGILLGTDPQGSEADSAAAARYGRLTARLQGVGVLGVRDVQALLADMAGPPEPLHRIWNDDTQHSVVFEPRRRRMYVAVRTPEGLPGAYQTISLMRGAAGE